MALADWIRIEQVSSAGRAEIGGRRIYILPTRYGFIFAALLFLMLLGAVNYGNNPAHLLTFLLAAFASNAIYLTWRNLRGLRLACQGAAPVFAGQPARFIVALLPDGRERPAIQLTIEDSLPALLDLPAGGGAVVRELQLNDLPRGLYRPGRLQIGTQYPAGLFRAWCYVACDRAVLVYPRPGESWLPQGSEGGLSDAGSFAAGNEDFAGLRAYLPGDQPSRIDWKSYARDRGLNTRLFSGHAAAPVWIDWDQAPGHDTEARISALTRAVIDAEAGNRRFGLRTPAAVIEPGSGAAHRHQCLRHLALYGRENG